MLTEAGYQAKLIKKLEKTFPGCWVIKNDAAEKQGIPDLLVLFRNIWFMLEVKLSATSPHQPNQPFYVDQLNQMSFCMFIYPENEDQVFDALQSTFGVSR